ncbi:MAG: hypothetical protein R3Y28_06425 [Candidatus Gastranaerophilales bacterium]
MKINPITTNQKTNNNIKNNNNPNFEANVSYKLKKSLISEASSKNKNMVKAIKQQIEKVGSWNGLKSTIVEGFDPAKKKPNLNLKQTIDGVEYSQPLTGKSNLFDSFLSLNMSDIENAERGINKMTSGKN